MLSFVNGQNITYRLKLTVWLWLCFQFLKTIKSNQKAHKCFVLFVGFFFQDLSGKYMPSRILSSRFCFCFCLIGILDVGSFYKGQRWTGQACWWYDLKCTITKTVCGAIPRKIIHTVCTYASHWFCVTLYYYSQCVFMLRASVAWLHKTDLL